MNNKILITGAAGFIGCHLAKQLLDNGENVFGVDDLSGGFLENLDKRLKFTKLDLREKDSVYDYIKQIKPSLVYHLAADASEGRSQFTPLNCTERNYLAYLHLLIPCIKFGMEKIVLTSSMSVYGSQKPPFDETMDTKPDDIYGISKASMEQATKVLSKIYNFKFVIARPHNVYGPKQNLSDPYRNVIGIFINSVLNNKPFYIYGDGEQKRAFTYIDDFIPYFAKLGFLKKCEGQIINLGPTKVNTINDVAKVILCSFFGDVSSVPKELTPIHLPDRPLEVKEAYCTSSKAVRLLNYKPRFSLEEGIKKMVFWAKTIGPSKPKYLSELELISNDTPKTWLNKLI